MRHCFLRFGRVPSSPLPQAPIPAPAPCTVTCPDSTTYVKLTTDGYTCDACSNKYGAGTTTCSKYSANTCGAGYMRYGSNCIVAPFCNILGCANCSSATTCARCFPGAFTKGTSTKCYSCFDATMNDCKQQCSDIENFWDASVNVCRRCDVKVSGCSKCTVSAVDGRFQCDDCYAASYNYLPPGVCTYKTNGY